jgi:hypothetical protein
LIIFFEQIPLVTWQKEELKAAPDRGRYYLDAISWHDLNRAQDACGKFHLHLLKNGIFMPPAIKKKLSDMDDLLAGVIGERRSGLQNPNTAMAGRFDKGVALDASGSGLLKSLEKDLQDRLRNSPAVKS